MSQHALDASAPPASSRAGRATGWLSSLAAAVRRPASARSFHAADLADELGDECCVLSNARVGDLVVSQLVIAPAGLFAIETDASARRVLATRADLKADGRDRYSLVCEVRDHAMAVRDHLRTVRGGRAVFVTPVLAFLGAHVESDGRCKGVHIMPAEDVAGFILTDKPRLDAAGRAWALEALGASA